MSKIITIQEQIIKKWAIELIVLWLRLTSPYPKGVFPYSTWLWEKGSLLCK